MNLEDCSTVTISSADIEIIHPTDSRLCHSTTQSIRPNHDLSQFVENKRISGCCNRTACDPTRIIPDRCTSIIVFWSIDTDAIAQELVQVVGGERSIDQPRLNDVYPTNSFKPPCLYAMESAPIPHWSFTLKTKKTNLTLNWELITIDCRRNTRNLP